MAGVAVVEIVAPVAAADVAAVGGTAAVWQKMSA